MNTKRLKPITEKQAGPEPHNKGMKTKLFNDPAVYGEDSDRILEAGWRCRLYKKQDMYGFAVEKWDAGRREWKWRCGSSGLRNIGVLLREVATETDGTNIPLCAALPLARSVAAKIKRHKPHNQGMKTKTPGRMKPLTEEQAGQAVAHWRRALTQTEAAAAAKAVEKAFADAGIEADVSGPVLLAKGESSLFGRVYRYSAGKCPLWGSVRFSHMGWASPFVVAKLKSPIKKKRCFALGGSTVKDLTEVRVRVELTAGHRTYERACRKGADPREDYKDVKNSRERTEKIDADPRWECEVWDADVYTDGRVRGYRRRGWGVYQPRDAFVFAPTQRGLHFRIAEVVDSMARELGIGKYAPAR